MFLLLSGGHICVLKGTPTRRFSIQSAQAVCVTIHKGSWVKLFMCLISILTIGNPGSVIAPQYGSSKITVFVWGKNAILKFLGNTKYRSMKLALQLVVVVLNAPTKCRDNLFKFTLYTIIIYKVGDTRCHFRRHAPFQHNFFYEIRTPKENKHARIVKIG